MDTKIIETEEMQEAISREEDLLKKIGINEIPFQTRLSFLPIINHIEQRVSSEDFAESFLAKNILQKLKEVPQFRKPIKDLNIIKDNKEFVQMLMLELFPPGLRNTQLSKVAAPFGPKPLYLTPALEELWNNHEVDYKFNNSSNIMYCATIVRACSLILNRFYNQDISVDPPMSLTVRKEGSALLRHYKTVMDLQFIEIHKCKPLKELSQEQINHMLSNIYDIDLWLENIPPENFEFHGFMIGNLVEITEEEALSRLKYSLLEKDAVVSPNKIQKLQDLVRTYFGIEELKLGLTAIDYPMENAVPHRYKIRFDFLADKHPVLLAPENSNSIYEKVCKYREVLLIEDLKEVSNKTPIEKDLLKKGVRSIIVAPLINKNDDVIGILEIGSKVPYQLHSFVELKFKELIGLFSMAIERSREEIDNRVEAILREQFTAVHSSVEWKFIETSYNLLEKREQNQHATVDPIVFNDVYPLYGQADIVSSSSKRNTAIQNDLLENLEKAEKVLKNALKEIKFPLVNQVLMKVGRGISELKKEFNSNDESRILDLLQQEVHPLLYELRNKYPDMASMVSGYFDLLDPELGIIYKDRKAYEDSVSMVNSAISGFLDQEEKEAQKILPHYFEKYKTDGVEYDIYVGQSLLRKDRFSMMHLRNFRLWQLMHMCEITKKIKDLQKELPVSLDTAQLIFAYTNPLSIRFRMDEKQFDVDGAYNVRYEILKKRIDKSVIEGTEERLTIAGKIAIVYLQERDRQEYLEYFDFLQTEEFITDEIEDLKLGKLQGVQGLRALRITVKLD